MAGRTYLFAISLGAHVALGASLLALPARARHEIIAITMAEAPKAKTVAHVEPPPPQPDPPKAAAAPLRAKAAPTPKAAPAEPVNDAPPSSGDAVPDFGIALSNGSGPGIAIPTGPRAAAPQTVTATTRALKRPTHAATGDCDDPPAKPKLLSRPTPAYTDDARVAGIAGKVRVEITVDDHGRVESVRVIQGLGHGLDEAAVAAARAMTFEPALRCGKASPATFKVGFSFSPGTP